MKIKKLILWTSVLTLSAAAVIYIVVCPCLWSLSDATDLAINTKRYGLLDTIKGDCLGMTNSGIYKKFQDPVPVGRELAHLHVATYNTGYKDPWGYEYCYATAGIWQRFNEQYAKIGSVRVWFSRGNANTDKLAMFNGFVEKSVPSNKVVEYRSMLVMRLGANGDCIETNMFISIKPPLLVSEVLSDRYMQQALTDHTMHSGEIVSYVVSERQPAVPLASK
ncbi:MAG TPA: hypothetical protein VL335_03190 [Candidatus Paceibacterota bacterium]|nr:hypothetical protein [Candidatus Paceibacterota bacterium]